MAIVERRSRQELTPQHVGRGNVLYSGSAKGKLERAGHLWALLLMATRSESPRHAHAILNYNMACMGIMKPRARCDFVACPAEVSIITRECLRQFCVRVLASYELITNRGPVPSER